MATKTTKKENFKVIAEILEGLGRTDLQEVMLHEIELLNKKATNGKMTKTQEQNEVIKNKIVEELVALGKAVTITELLSQSEEVRNLTNNSNQKVSALMTQLKNAGLVTREQDKKVARFRAN